MQMQRGDGRAKAGLFTGGLLTRLATCASGGAKLHLTETRLQFDGPPQKADTSCTMFCADWYSGSIGLLGTKGTAL